MKDEGLTETEQREEDGKRKERLMMKVGFRKRVFSCNGTNSIQAESQEKQILSSGLSRQNQSRKEKWDNGCCQHD